MEILAPPNPNGRLSILINMAQQTVVNADSIGDLQAESFRLTAFLAPDEQVAEPTWWADLVGSPPETRTSKPGRGELQEAGPFGDATLVLSLQPGRVDWYLTPRFEEDVPQEVRWAGRFADTAKVFGGLMARWLENCPALIRLAFGAIGHQPVRDRVEAYTLLARYLPAIEMDIEHSEDFLYQINRPRESAIVTELKINRLSKWTAALFVGLRLDVSKAVIQQRLAGGQTSCRMEFDISTDAARTKEFPRVQLPALFEELKNLALELATKGDVP